MTKAWHPDISAFDGPKYLALARALRESVRDGQLTEGTRLPPVRELAWALSVTPGTVARAYQIVTQEGLLEATVGRGTFVATRMPRLGPTQPMFVDPPPADAHSRPLTDLRSPCLPEVGQAAALSAILVDMAGRLGPEHLHYPSSQSDLPLRRAYAAWLADQALGPFGPEDIVLTLGGQNALNVALQCCLRGERPHVFCEELSYSGFRRAARLNRAEVDPVAIDDQGMIPAALDTACRRTGGRIICLTPEAQNPTAAAMGLERRIELVRVARAHDLQILEDNCYSVPRAAEPSLRALAPERTWHLTSLSKSISAGLRFGGIICPTGLGEAGRMAAQHQYFGLPRPITDIMLALLQSGEATRLRDRVQEEMDRRLEVALNILGRFPLRWQRGLSFLWLPLPRGWRGSTFTRQAEAAGVLIRSADEYAAVDGRAPSAVRIALSGVLPDAEFRAALTTLARLLDSPPDEIAV